MATERPGRQPASPLLRELRQAEKRIRRGESLDRAKVAAWVGAVRVARVADSPEAPALSSLLRVVLRRRVLAVLLRLEEVIRPGRPLVEPVLTGRFAAELRRDLEVAAELGGRTGTLRARLAALLTAQLAGRLTAFNQTIRGSDAREVDFSVNLLASLWSELIDAEVFGAPDLDPLATRLTTAQTRVERLTRRSPGARPGVSDASAGAPAHQYSGNSVLASRVGKIRDRHSWRLSPPARGRSLAGQRTIGLGARLQRSPGLSAILAFLRRIEGGPNDFLGSLRNTGRKTGAFALPDLKLVHKTVVQVDWIEGEADPWQTPSRIARSQTLAEALVEQGVQVELVRGRPVPAERYARDEARPAADFTIHGPQGPVILDRLPILDGAVPIAQRPGFIEVIVAPAGQQATASADADIARSTTPLPFVRPAVTLPAATAPAVYVPVVRRAQPPPDAPISVTDAASDEPLPAFHTPVPSSAAPPIETSLGQGRSSSIGATGDAEPLGLLPTLSTYSPMVTSVLQRASTELPRSPHAPPSSGQSDRIRIELDWVTGQDPWQQQAIVEQTREVARALENRGVRLEIVRGREVPVARYTADQGREARDYVLPSAHGPVSLASLDLLDRAVPVEQRPGFLRVLLAPRRGTAGETSGESLTGSTLAASFEGNVIERGPQPLIFTSRLSLIAGEPDTSSTTAPWLPASAFGHPSEQAHADAPTVYPRLAGEASRPSTGMRSGLVEEMPGRAPTPPPGVAGDVLRRASILPRESADGAADPATSVGPGLAGEVPGLPPFQRSRSAGSALGLSRLAGDVAGADSLRPTDDLIGPRAFQFVLPGIVVARMVVTPDMGAPTPTSDRASAESSGESPALRPPIPHGDFPFVQRPLPRHEQLPPHEALTPSVAAGQLGTATSPMSSLVASNASVAGPAADREQQPGTPWIESSSADSAGGHRAMPALVSRRGAGSVTDLPVPTDATALPALPTTEQGILTTSPSSIAAGAAQPIVHTVVGREPVGPDPRSGAADLHREFAEEIVARMAADTTPIPAALGAPPAASTPDLVLPSLGAALLAGRARPEIARETAAADSIASDSPPAQRETTRLPIGMAAPPQTDLWTSLRREQATPGEGAAGPLVRGPRPAVHRFPRTVQQIGSLRAPTWIIAPEALRHAVWASAIDAAPDAEPTQTRATADQPLVSWQNEVARPVILARQARSGESQSLSEQRIDAAEPWYVDRQWHDAWLADIARTVSPTLLTSHEWLPAGLSPESGAWIAQAITADEGTLGSRSLPGLATNGPLGSMPFPSFGASIPADEGIFGARALAGLAPPGPLGATPFASFGVPVAADDVAGPATPTLAEAWFASLHATSSSPREAPLPSPSASAALPGPFGHRRLVMAPRPIGPEADLLGRMPGLDDGAQEPNQLLPIWAAASDEGNHGDHGDQMHEPMQTVSPRRMQEIARAAVNRAIGGGSDSGAIASSSSNVVSSTSSNANAPGQPNLDTLARQVYGIIKRRLSVEQERFGGGRAARLW